MNKSFTRGVFASAAVAAMLAASYAAEPKTSQNNTKAPAKKAAAKAATATKSESAATKSEASSTDAIREGDWNQWGGSSDRNNTPDVASAPIEWDIGEFDNKTGEWKKDTATNVLWAARLGSQTYGNPVVANGRVYVGTNNGAGWLERYPADVDLGVLLCFDEKTGDLLWQHSSEKLPTGRVHDWPLQGICCSPLIEGDRVWFVTSRGEVRCLDAKGFHDGENNGPFKDEPNENKNEADVLWVLEMMKPPLNVSQHNMASCSLTSAGDLLFVNTSNGVDEGHYNLPSPNAPSFLAVDKNTGEVLWADNSPGPNVLHGQWSSPAYAVLGGVPQVIFGAGDGYVYSFLGTAENENGKPKLLWKFDCNPKESKYVLGGRADRNHIIGTPVIYNDLVYVAVGEDPEHGEGIGHLWCIDPTKRGDVSPELAFKVEDVDKPNPQPIPHRRNQAVIKEEGEIARANPNSAAVWHYAQYDQDEDGEITFEETMHRTIGSVAIKNDLLFIADFSGLFHCIDAKTGKPHWTYDMLAASWGSPLIAGDKVYIGDEDGDIAIFNLTAEKHDPIAEINVGNSVYSTPIVANNILYIANKTHLFAISAEAEPDADQQAAK